LATHCRLQIESNTETLDKLWVTAIVLAQVNDTKTHHWSSVRATALLILYPGILPRQAIN
jgi:hypothetical protein